MITTFDDFLMAAPTERASRKTVIEKSEAESY